MYPLGDIPQTPNVPTPAVGTQDWREVRPDARRCSVIPNNLLAPHQHPSRWGVWKLHVVSLATTSENHQTSSIPLNAQASGLSLQFYSWGSAAWGRCCEAIACTPVVVHVTDCGTPSGQKSSSPWCFKIKKMPVRSINKWIAAKSLWG